jgi:hypothetical protein
MMTAMGRHTAGTRELSSGASYTTELSELDRYRSHLLQHWFDSKHHHLTKKPWTILEQRDLTKF